MKALGTNDDTTNGDLFSKRSQLKYMVKLQCLVLFRLTVAYY